MTTSRLTEAVVNELEQEAAAATARAQAARDAAAGAQADSDRLRDQTQAVRDERERAYRRERLARFDRVELVRQETAARRAFYAALEADPLVQAFVAWQTARLWNHTAAEAANTDAQVAGAEPAVRGLGSVGPTPDLFPDQLSRDVGNLVADMLGQRLDLLETERREHVLAGAAPRTAEEQLAYEAAEDERRRRQRATVSSFPPIDVEGMTEQERARLGLPPGR